MATPKNSSRGKFITILVVISFIGALLSIPGAFNPTHIQKDFGAIPAWYSPAMLVSIALQLAGLVGIWMWKKWGVYAYFATFLIGFGSAFTLLKTLPNPGFAQLTFMFVLTYLLASGGLWAWALSRKWSNFS